MPITMYTILLHVINHPGLRDLWFDRKTNKTRKTRKETQFFGKLPLIYIVSYTTN